MSLSPNASSAALEYAAVCVKFLESSAKWIDAGCPDGELWIVTHNAHKDMQNAHNNLMSAVGEMVQKNKFQIC